MRQQPAANAETLKFPQLVIRADRPELQDLVEGGMGAGRLGIAEDETHPPFFWAGITQTGCRGGTAWRTR